MKNINTKVFIFLQIIILVTVFIFTIIVSNTTYDKYSSSLEENYSYILNNLAEDDPKLQEKIVDLILDKEYKNDKVKLDILEKYGITKEDLALSTNRKEFKKTILTNNFLLVFGSLFLVFVTFMIFAFNRKKKIKAISSYINAILNDNYDMNIRDFNEGSISRLKNDIYKVTIKLKENRDLLLEDKKNLEETLSDISHQLKTPLTSMYITNDLLATDLSEDTKREILAKNALQLKRIEWLVTSLLKISRLDSGTVRLKKEDTLVSDVINRALLSLKVPIELKNINLVVECPSDARFNVDINWTSEALLNIIKNAYEHTNEYGMIKIKVVENPIYLEIAIFDNGCGIKDKDINHIFERFYKGEENSESIGIGLNMAKKIIDLENGEIKVKSKVDVGTVFFIRFYKSNV